MEETDRLVSANVEGDKDDAHAGTGDYPGDAAEAAVVGEVIDFDIVLASASPRRRDILE